MSLVNIYLEGSNLTSSKNKLLQDRLLIDSFEEYEKTEYPSKKHRREFAIPQNCLTENKILLENEFDSWRDGAFKKKKNLEEKFLKDTTQNSHDFRSKGAGRKKRKFKVKRFRSRSRSSAYHASEDDAIREKEVAISRVYTKAAPSSRVITAESAIFQSVGHESLQADSVDFGNSQGFAFGSVAAPPMPANIFGSSQTPPMPAPPMPANFFGSSQNLTLGSSPGFAYSSAPGLTFGSSQAQQRAPKLFRSPQRFAYRSAPDCDSIPETFISKMPTYSLETLNLSMDMESEFFSFDMTASYKSENIIANPKEKKMHLLNVISMALMYPSNLRNKCNNYRKALDKSADDVRFFDPEFILKVALYARQELHIRTVTNFMLAYAAFYENTRIYLEKYFEACIVLPTDWIEVAEYYQVLSSKAPKQSFPAVLRRAMKKTFSKFDQYQLAKYNREISKKKKFIEEEDEVDKEDQESKNEDDDKDQKEVESVGEKKKHVSSFTLKKLIRILHINSPTEHVLCLLGKKYPVSSETFKLSGLPGTWDSTKAGTRMKLPIPETWETKLSLLGNVPHAWESLIDDNKLPYMAMLRNLRNLINSGISPVHHKKVIKHLENKKAVINSRQLPMQFYEAYKVISGLEKMLENTKLHYSCCKPQSLWKRERDNKLKERLNNASLPVIEQYKSAISKALDISSQHNLHPVPGKTLVICMIESTFDYIKLFKHLETLIMMGLMCLKACENCKLNILFLSSDPDVISLNENDTFLDILMETCTRYKKMLTAVKAVWKDPIPILKKILDYYLRPQTMLSLKLDHIVVLHNTHRPIQDVMSSFLNKYRQIVNSNLLYTSVNYSWINSQKFSKSCLSDKDVYLCGASNSLIKFIADRSIGGQLFYVESIDEKYNLPKIGESKKHMRNVDNLLSTVPQSTAVVPINCKMPKWHTVRIFISSTFKDMMSERDLLVRYVFPELRRRAASVFVRIVEVDLRWGITEADSSTKRAAELCLLEAQKADFFVGLIGDRYGTIYNFDPPDTTELEWVEDGCDELSITELEMHAAALRNPEVCRQKAFFYFRDNTFLRHVPKKWVKDFDSEDINSKNMVEALKNKIRANNFKILDGYPCSWTGIYENKPILSGLNVLGNRVLEDLWKAVRDVHKKDPYFDSVGEEEMHQQNLIDSQNFYVGEKNSPLEITIKNLKSKQGVFVICGCSGSGKTAFIIKLLQHLKGFTVVKFFIGTSPTSRDLTYMLTYIVDSICHQLSISISLPQSPRDMVNQFPDILMEAASSRGGKDLILIVDGLDHLEKEDQRLDWLPLSLPDGVKMIFTVSESSEAFKFLRGRQVSGNDIFIEELSSLIQSDREKFIKNYLNYYSKNVDQTAFTNYMLKVVTKKDSSNPFYLRIVCDFLRIYATFENLASMIEKVPSSISFLFQEIILQMENEFGSSLIQTVLILLCITKEGLEDNDLHFILSSVMYMNESKKTLTFSELKEKIKVLEPEQMLSKVKYCSLMYVITTFAYGSLMRQKSYSLVDTEFENAVKKFYLNKNYVSQSSYLHSVLAGYYYNICDFNKDGQYSQQSGFAIRSVLFHLFHANLYKELSDLLCNHKFLEAVFKANVGAQLLEYFSSLLYHKLPTNHKISQEMDSSLLLSFHDFVTRNFHIFHQYPQLIMQQALNEPPDSLVCLQNKDCNYHSLENLSRSDMLDYRLASFCGFMKNITASAANKDHGFVVLGTQDGYLKVLDLSTHKIVRTIKCHVSAITCICFVGKNKICVSSTDGTLSLWDSIDFNRVAVLKGHRFKVTSCCADPLSSILYSSGWDNSVRLWSLVDGRSISVIDKFRFPVNCIDHHPLKQQIACGLWSGNIEIWDTVSLQKILEFPSFCGSVKSLAYTPDGVNIISSFIESEISIWSSEEGIKISSLKGHILPVKALSSFNDNSIFISGSDDCTLKVWSSVHGSHFSTISDCKFCPISLMNFMSGNLLAVAFQNSDLWIIDINCGSVICKITLEADSVSTFSKYSFITINSADPEDNFFEKSVVFGTRAGKLMIGYLSTSSVSVKAEMNSKITAVIHNCDTIICGSADGDIGVFSYPDEMLFRIIFAAHKGFISTFSLALEGEKLFVLSAANDNVLKLWNIDKDNADVFLHQELMNKHKDGITCSLFYPHSCDSDSLLLDNLLTGSHDNNIISWNRDSMKMFQGLHSSVLNIACSGDFVLGCGNDGAVVIWSQSRKILSSIPGIKQSSTLLTFFIAEDDVNKFTVTLAFVEQDGSIKINKSLERTYRCSFEGHSKPVTSCCTTGDGNVISCSLDGTVNLWKIPVDSTNIQLMHSSVVTGVIVSPCLKFAVSADAHGNLIFWKIDTAASTTPFTYVGKKSYVGGFIRALSWLTDNSIVYAVTKVLGSDDESYFVHITSFKYTPSNETSAFSFQLKKSYYFKSEILSLDSSNTGVIIVGLKSGSLAVIDSEKYLAINISDDWILGVQLLSGEGKFDLCCSSLVDGRIAVFKVDDLLLCAEKKTVTPIQVYKPSTVSNGSKLMSSLCCEGKLICSGDSGGVLQIYYDHCLKFIEKVHSDAISGICIVGSYLFTSSYDKTVKGWDLKSFKQICQFHSNVPISCLASPDIGAEACDENSCILLIGTTSGNVHMLKFLHK